MACLSLACLNGWQQMTRGACRAPVVGPQIIGNRATLKGLRGARVFRPLEGAPEDFVSGDDISAAVGLR